MCFDDVRSMERASLAFVRAMDHDPLIGRIIGGDASREDYSSFLAGTYHYVRWSGPLLAATARGLRRTGRYSWLLELVDAKTAEEAPHDRWALADLRCLGEDVAAVVARTSPVAVDAYVHWSRAMAADGSPAFLGAAYTLELLSMHRAKAAAENLCARKAIPGIEGAVSFLEGHGDADEGHVALLRAALGRLEDPLDLAAVSLTAALTRSLFPRFFSRS